MKCPKCGSVKYVHPFKCEDCGYTLKIIKIKGEQIWKKH